MNYISVNNILSKLHRELRNTTLNDVDIIEWIGEAMDFIKVAETHQEVVSLIRVNNFRADLPANLHYVVQLQKYNKTVEECKCRKEEIEKSCEEDKGCIIEEIQNGCTDCCYKGDAIDYLLGDLDTSIRPNHDVYLPINSWIVNPYTQQMFEPIRLATNTFIEGLICPETFDTYKKDCCGHEYKVIGDYKKQFLFNFEEGYVALSYLKSMVDEDGYPMIIDDIRYISAVNYYIRWKLSEYYSWNGREGSDRLVQYNMQLWLKYAKQAKNYAKMPKTLDEMQNNLESQFDILPNRKKYFGYFGNLGRHQTPRFQFNMRNKYY